MAEKGIDFLFVGPGSDMKYISNYSAMASERLSLFILPVQGNLSFIGPLFEMPRFELSKTKTFYDLLAWEEHEDPVGLIAKLVDPAKKATIAVDDRHQARFFLRYMERFPRAKFVSTMPVLGEMRIHKDATEIEYLVHLGRALDKVWEEALRLQYSGRKQSEVGLELAENKRKIFMQAGEPRLEAPQGSSGPSSGINTSSAHGGGGDRVIQPSDAIYWEMGGGSCMGYAGDKTRSAQVAPATEEYKKAYEVVKEAQQTAFKAVHPGVTCESVDLAGRRIIEKAGYGKYFTHRIGHGLGLDGHEYPYLVRGNKMKLEPGMVFSIEPGVYLPGKWGIRIEDIVYVTEDGAKSLYSSTKEFHEVK
jgi:Xaa-Pro aminopeptidase